VDEEEDALGLLSWDPDMVKMARRTAFIDDDRAYSVSGTGLSLAHRYAFRGSVFVDFIAFSH
jgi:hypothetical protein